jgi:hypothetical protein
MRKLCGLKKGDISMSKQTVTCKGTDKETGLAANILSKEIRERTRVRRVTNRAWNIAFTEALGDDEVKNLILKKTEEHFNAEKEEG